MKLVFPSRSQQLLSTLLGCLLLLGGRAGAQVDAVITYKPTAAQPQPVQAQAKVTAVAGGALMVKEQFGERGVPLAQIQTVQMARPAEAAAAQQAFEARDFGKALAAAQTVMAKWKGLPADWAASTAALIGDIALAQNDTTKAEAAYNDFAKLYPGNGSADLGKARVAVAKKDFDAAKRVAEPLAEKALKEKNVSMQANQIFGQTFLVLGQIKEAEGNFDGALADYLRTTTLFYQDRTAVSLAQERADAIRKSHHAFVP